MNQENKELYKKALEKWGEKAQLGMIQEECAELIVAVNKWFRNGDMKSYRSLCSELADVEIMLEQARVMVHTPSQIDIEKKEKLERLKILLEGN